MKGMEEEELCKMYREIVLGYMMKMTKNKELAEEITQETFYKATLKSHQFKGTCDMGTWLCSIAKNIYFSLLRKKKPIVVQDESACTVPDFSDAIADHALALEAYRMLHSLEEPYREVLMLRIFCDLQHREIAQLFCKSESWARVTYHRGKQMLCEKMRAQACNLKGEK